VVTSVDQLYFCLDFNGKISSFRACVCCSFPGFMPLDLRYFQALLGCVMLFFGVSPCL
jgi:hypothetical protein